MGDKGGMTPDICIVEPDIHIRRGEQAARLFRPFDQNHRLITQDFPESCIHPFARIAKSIKIKVIEV